MITLLSPVGMAGGAAAQSAPALPFAGGPDVAWDSGRADDAAMLARLDAMSLRRDEVAGPVLRFSVVRGDVSQVSVVDRERPEVPVLVAAPTQPPSVGAPRTRSLAPRSEPVRSAARRSFRMPWQTGVFQ